MTTPTLPSGAAARPEARPGDGRPRRVDLALARAHLRLGSFALARTELETLAGLGALDAHGLVDLAEVRWRTGDLPGAGEAAAVALEAGADAAVALLIAAEAASADGRPSEARRLAGHAMAALDGRVDRVFAGMPRSAVWPPDAAEPPPTAATMFHREADDDGGLGVSRHGRADASSAAAGVPPGRLDDRGGGSPGSGATDADAAGETGGPLTLGFWDADSDQASAAQLPDPDEAFQAGRAALIAGSFEEAAFRFALAIRFAPALAPAVLEATDGARSVPLIMVRGDAYRLVGHESEARQAWTLAALGGPPERRKRPRTPEARLDGAAGGRDYSLDRGRGVHGGGDGHDATDAGASADAPDGADRRHDVEPAHPDPGDPGDATAMAAAAESIELALVDAGSETESAPEGGRDTAGGDGRNEDSGHLGPGDPPDAAAMAAAAESVELALVHAEPEAEHGPEGDHPTEPEPDQDPDVDPRRDPDADPSREP